MAGEARIRGERLPGLVGEQTGRARAWVSDAGEWSLGVLCLWTRELNTRGRGCDVYCRSCRAEITSVVILLPGVAGDFKMGDAGEVSVALRSVVTAAIKSIFYGELYAGLREHKGLLT